MNEPVAQQELPYDIEPPLPEQETVNVDNIDMFARLIAGWHHNRVLRLEHMLQVPVGTPMQIDDGEARPLLGDLREGFLAGLHVALSEFGVLPFTVHTEEDEAETAEPATAEVVALGANV